MSAHKQRACRWSKTPTYAQTYPQHWALSSVNSYKKKDLASTARDGQHDSEHYNSSLESIEARDIDGYRPRRAAGQHRPDFRLLAAGGAGGHRGFGPARAPRSAKRPRRRGRALSRERNCARAHRADRRSRARAASPPGGPVRTRTVRGRLLPAAARPVLRADVAPIDRETARVARHVGGRLRRRQR